jgi:hypothetical protein
MDKLLELYPIESILNSLPANRPLYKDSGLWQVRTGDMENVYIGQKHNESFFDFIVRYVEFLKEFEPDDYQTCITDLAWD